MTMMNYPAYTQIDYPPNQLIYLSVVLPLSNVDAGSDLSDEEIHDNIELVKTAPYSDQFKNQD